MPRYFFDLHEGSQFSPDDTGIDYASVEDAISDAKRLPAQIACDQGALQGEECQLGVVLRSESGEALFTVTLALTSSRLDAPALLADHI